MAITEKWLRANSISQSFQRGKSYKSSVQQITKQGSVYTAIVYGTSRYKVKIVDELHDIDCSCTCPYDLSGLCKHIIAVGLCIIEGDFKSQPQRFSATPTPKFSFVGKPLPIDKLNFYDKTFSVARPSQQETFLRTLFAENEDLCRRFLAFQQTAAATQALLPAPVVAPSMQLPTSVDDFAECSQAIAGLIMSIDTGEYAEERDEDYDDYDYDEYGEDDYEEDTQYDKDGLTQTVVNQLNPYYEKCLTLLKQRKMLDSVYGLLCLYEASFLAEPEEWMEMEDFTFQDMMYNDWEVKVKLWMDIAKRMPFQNHDYQSVIDLIWQRRDHFERFNKSKEDYIPYSSFAEMENFVPWATPTLHAKRQFLNDLEERHLLGSKNHSLTEILCKALKDNDLLLHCFEKYGSESVELSMGWLKLLLELGERPKWVEVAHKIYNTNELKSRLNIHFSKSNYIVLDDYIFEHLKAEDNLIFFKAFMGAYARERQNVIAYQRWKTVASLAELELYYHELRTKYPSVYIQWLKADEKYEDLLAYARALVIEPRSSLFLAATEPILNLKESEVLSLHQERILHQMDTGKKSRDSYAEYVSDLKPVLKMVGKRKEVKGFAEMLRSRYMRYPAFVDELKKGGF